MNPNAKTSKKAMSRTRKVLVLLGCCCIAAAAALFLYNQWDTARAQREAAKLTADLAVLLQEAAENAAKTTEETAAEPTGEAAAEPTGPEAGEGSLSVDGYDLCGMLRIDALDLELAVLSDWSYQNLKVSACRYDGTPEGQLILLAHNYRKHFAGIGGLVAGDAVSFTAADGTEYDYVVTGTETWNSDQMREILAGDWDLTLFTCTYSGEARVVVRCAKQEAA